MIALRRRTISTAVVALALGWAVAGCSSDEPSTAPGVNPAVVGTWNATSFLAGGTDFITQGMGLSFVLSANGTYSFNITNDQGGLCDPGMTDCTDTGNYTASGTQIVLDPGTTDTETLNYSISGTTMTITGNIDGTAITVVLNKA